MATNSSAAFDRAFTLVIGHEGKFSTDREDPGNWTGGKVDAGEFKGTKYGISAAAYPSLDIKNLTLQDARTIYLRDYWGRCACDLLPYVIALEVFDAAVQHGQSRAVKLLQEALGFKGKHVDGSAGPLTRAAAQAADLAPLLVEFFGRRQIFYTGITSLWGKNGRGWMIRMANQMIRAAQDLKGV